MAATENTLKVGGNGSSITINTSNTEEWYKAMSTYYYDNIDESHPTIDTTWNDNRTDEKMLDTEVRYSNKSKANPMNLTMRLYHTTGTFLIQGAAKNITIWQTNHYPALLAIIEKQRKEAELVITSTESDVAAASDLTSDSENVTAVVERDVTIKQPEHLPETDVVPTNVEAIVERNVVKAAEIPPVTLPETDNSTAKVDETADVKANDKGTPTNIDLHETNAAQIEHDTRPSTNNAVLLTAEEVENNPCIDVKTPLVVNTSYNKQGPSSSLEMEEQLTNHAQINSPVC